MEQGPKDFVVAPRCNTRYNGPSFARFQGVRCSCVVGHETLPKGHPLYSHRHTTGEGAQKISWFDEAQKEMGERGW